MASTARQETLDNLNKKLELLQASLKHLNEHHASGFLGECSDEEIDVLDTLFRPVQEELDTLLRAYKDITPASFH